MKNTLKILLCMFCAVVMFSCGNPNSDSKKDNKTETKKTLNEQIEEAIPAGSVDFKNAVIAEDASVEGKITIKNLDMGGKTLTIYASGVELENVKNAIVIVVEGDVSLKNCSNIKKLEVKKSAIESDTLLIDATQIETIEIDKKGIRIVLKDKDTEVKDIVISAKDTVIEAEQTDSSNAPVVETLTVTEDADNVSISGGKIENLVVETSEEIPEENKPVVTLTGKTEISNVEGIETIYVTEEAKDTVTVPQGTKTEEVTEVDVQIIAVDTVKTEYIIGEKFDYSSLAVKIYYSNGSSKIIALTEDNCELDGFTSSAIGTYNVTLTYDSRTEYSFPISVRKPDLKDGASAKEYISEAIELLSMKKPNIDLALSYFKKAYEKEKTDETKLYYALAELAAISTDSSVSKLLKENFGLKNYPSSMNALFSTSWMKEYLRTTAVTVVEFAKDPSGEYVRGFIKDDYSVDSDIYFYPEYNEFDGMWIDGYNNYGSYGEIIPSNKGDRLFTISYYGYWNKYKDIEDERTDAAYQEYLAFRETYKDCLYTPISYTTRQLPYSAFYGYDYSSLIPEFKVIDENDTVYQATLYNSIKTSETMAYLMLKNFFTCNAEGFNSLIDNILGVFGNRYENAKALVADLKQESIEIPADIIAALNLDGMLGSSKVNIGKAETDVLFAAMDIVKGVFQWISSYDLSLDLDILEKQVMSRNYSGWSRTISEYSQELEYNLMNTITSLLPITNAKTLTVRNSAAMDSSKATILNAVNTVIASYEYITGPSKTYPSKVKSDIKNNAGPVYTAAKDFAAALKNGKVFELKSDKDNSVAFSIDLGKLFTAGYFTNILVKDSDGNIAFTTYGYSKNWDGEVYHYSQNKEYPLSLESKKIYSELCKILEPEINAMTEADNWTINELYGYLSVNLKLIADLIPSAAADINELPCENGILNFPVSYYYYTSIHKPLEQMKGSWFSCELDLTQIIELWNLDDTDFFEVNANVEGGIGIGFMGKVKDIKEKGFVNYGLVNKYFPSFNQYSKKEELPANLNFNANDSISAGKVKLFVYSNMTEPEPGTTPEVNYVLSSYKYPLLTSYQSGSSYVAYYDWANSKSEYGYAKPAANASIVLNMIKVQ